MNSIQQDLLLVGASAIAGAVNSVAGGGTLLTFPVLIYGAGVAPLIANATSTVALWPGQLSSLWGFRREIGQNVRSITPLIVIGLVGGVAGAFLLLNTPSKVFDRIVPYLVLLATSLFMVQEPLARWQRARTEHQAKATPAGPARLRLSLIVAVFLLLIAVYGGYFGAGIGILTLAAFGFLGLTDIHQMNGIKAAFTLGINGVAAIIFVTRGLVDYRVAGIMALGAIVGGYAGADIARRIGQKSVRRIVIALGFVLTLSLLRRH
jgi:uncharacterized membrane protein YfcA